MSGFRQLVVFSVDDQEYGLDLSCVERIVRAVEITRLPEAPADILGVINVEGEIIPVLNSRRRLELPEREIELSDHFIVVKGSGKSCALIADKVEPVAEVPEQRLVFSDTILPSAGCVSGMAKEEEGMIIILDVEGMLHRGERESVRVSVQTLGSEAHD